ISFEKSVSILFKKKPKRNLGDRRGAQAIEKGYQIIETYEIWEYDTIQLSKDQEGIVVREQDLPPTLTTNAIYARASTSTSRTSPMCMRATKVNGDKKGVETAFFCALV
ncbi:unnamed protein product, partial [Acanthoscelides obtectus]